MRGSMNQRSRMAGSNTIRGHRTRNGANIVANSAGYAGSGGGVGNYVTNQHTENGVDIGNIYPTHRYLPKNPLHQNAVFRQIYRYDSTAGAVIELYSNMPWSDFQLGNIQDTAIRNLYEDAFSNLDLTTKLPHLTRDYLILGKMCGFLTFDESKGVWSDLIQQNPDYIRAFPIPFSNQDPLIFLQPPREMATLAQKIINLNIQIDDPDSKRLLQLAAAMQPTQLDNASTFYLPRKSFVDDYNGTSIYTRILSLVLLESALLNANLLNAFRRAGPIRLLSPDPEQGEMMAPEQLDSIALMFMEADMDPVGSTIVLDKAIQVDSIANANEGQWRVFDEWGTLQSAKMNALGFSESFISGESSYRSGDNEISIFLERLRALRTEIENQVMTNHICLNMAKANDFVKRTKAEMDHKIRIKGSSQYIIPTFQWNKPLTPVGNQDYIALLNQAEASGVHISLRTWASACGVDFVAETENLMQDAKDRSLMQRYQQSNNLITDDDRPIGAPDPKVFVNVVTTENFTLLEKEQILNYFSTYKGTTSSMRLELIPAQFVLFQLYLACVGVPYENLTDDEFDILDKEMQANNNVDSKLSDFFNEKIEDMKKHTLPKDKIGQMQRSITKDSEDEENAKNGTGGTETGDKNTDNEKTNQGKVSKEILEQSLQLALADVLRDTGMKKVRDATLVNTNLVKMDDTSKSITERLIKLRNDIGKMTPEEVTEFMLENTQQDDQNINDNLKETVDFVRTLKLGDDVQKNFQIIMTQLKLRNAQTQMQEEAQS